MTLETLLYLCSLEGGIYPKVGVGADSGSGFLPNEASGAPVDFIHLAGDKG